MMYKSGILLQLEGKYLYLFFHVSEMWFPTPLIHGLFFPH